MLSGHIYPPGQGPGSSGALRQDENLVARRELALRFVAAEAEEELLDFPAAHRPGPVSDTNERVMVALTNAPGSEGVARRPPASPNG